MEIYEEQLKTLIRVFRRDCCRVLDSERTTIHGADSMLRVLQLAAAEVSKQKSGEFGVALSNVLVAWKRLLLDKLHLLPDNPPLVENYDLIRKEYDCFLKLTNTVDLIDVYNLYKQLKRDEDPEDPMTTVHLFHFLLGNMEDFQEAELIFQTLATPSNRASSSQIIQEQRAVRRLFCSYLGLLVNFKNDLALADILDTPSRSLGHTAFTDLKYAARKNCTSLFLAVTSFIRAIELGGKGYAPPECDPLRKHTKGFSQFVHFIDQLEELLGDTIDPSVAGARMLSSIRAAVLKGRSNVDPVYTLVEKSVQDLKERITQIHTIQKDSAGTGISPARPRAYAINHATAYAGRETVKILITLLDEEALVPPCRNKAQLLSDDQAVFNRTEGVCLLNLYKSPEAPTGLSPKPLRNRVQSQQEVTKSKIRERVIRSQFACTYGDDGLPLNRVLNFPSTSEGPTCLHPAPQHVSLSPDVPSEEQFETARKCKENGVGEEPEVVALACSHSAHKAVLGQKCSNSHTQTGVSENELAQIQRANKLSKRKLSNRDCLNQGTDENQPPQKKPPAKFCNSGRGKKNSNVFNKKLIAGQGKITRFFRL